MALLNYPDDSVLSREAQSILLAYPNNLVKMLGWLGPAFEPLMATLDKATGSSLISPVLREKLTLRIASRCDAPYVLLQHRSIARQIGMTDADMEMSLVSAEDPRLDDCERHVFRLIDELLLGIPTRETITAAKDTLGEDRLALVFLLFFSFSFLSKFSASVRVDPDTPILVTSR